MTALAVWVRCLVLGHDWQIRPVTAITPVVVVACGRCAAVPEWRTR